MDINELREKVKSLKIVLEQNSKIAREAKLAQVSAEYEYRANLALLHFEEWKAGDKVPVHKNGSKISECLRVIKEHANGMSPSEIQEELSGSGIEMKPNYVYTTLFKLVKAGSVRKEGRKYFSV